MAYLGNTILNKLYSFNPITATAGQTVFTSNYAVGMTLFFLTHSGSTKLLQVGTDITASDGTTMTLASGASVGDVLSAISLAQFNIGDAVPLSNVGAYMRRRLTENTDFYVATTGSDANGDGTSGNPWATITNAVNYIQSHIDLGGFVATINVAAGTYTAGAFVSGYFVGSMGAASLVIKGSGTTDCIINAEVCFSASMYGAFSVQGFKINPTTSGISAIYNGTVYFSDIDFGACAAGDHIFVATRGYIAANGNYTISGGALTHINIHPHGTGLWQNNTVTITGTPAFSSAFAAVDSVSVLYIRLMTFNGSATGPRYIVQGNSVVDTSGGGSSYLPGSSVGTTATGGQYV